MRSGVGKTEEIGIYLHFPFCVRKCAYCDFLSFPAGEELKKIYATSLIREIRSYAPAAADMKVTSIYLGGGTPSLMPPRMLRSIFEAVHSNYKVDKRAEVTMEMNPGTVSPGILPVVCEYVNRVSLGAQSADDGELRALGRIHRWRDTERSVELLRKAGIHNLSLDLMIGIPGQTMRSCEDTLKKVIGLGPEHISAYSLIIEEGTDFYRMNSEGTLILPSEEEERAMYALSRTLLERAGYRQYEFSNYANTGFRCRHNVRYGTRGSDRGFGIGAASLFKGSRWRNTPEIDLYSGAGGDPGRIISEMEQLDRRSEIEEHMFLGLRMTEGVTEEEFEARFSLPMGEVYGSVMERQIEEGLLATDGKGRYFLTDRGVEVSNVVLAEYLI
ncbi:MAG: radical SAM family heme chaperone HemW [Lachnospiraceae bacterium]|nr:radical SAM family heme chaperone HemW [Lachnospiraceae bacterium]